MLKNIAMAFDAAFSIVAFIGLVASLLFQPLLASQPTLHAVGHKEPQTSKHHVAEDDSLLPAMKETRKQAGGSSGSLEDLACREHCPTCSACPECPAAASPIPPWYERPIPPGYRYYEGLGYYKAHMELQNWFDAKATCEREGAYLAVMNSQKEADLAKSLLQKYGNGRYFFLGFHDMGNTTAYGHFITVLGDPLSETGYEVWGPNQPEGEERCGAIRQSDALHDLGCQWAEASLCELYE